MKRILLFIGIVLILLNSVFADHWTNTTISNNATNITINIDSPIEADAINITASTIVFYNFSFNDSRSFTVDNSATVNFLNWLNFSVSNFIINTSQLINGSGALAYGDYSYNSVGNFTLPNEYNYYPITWGNYLDCDNSINCSLNIDNKTFNNYYNTPVLVNNTPMTNISNGFDNNELSYAYNTSNVGVSPPANFGRTFKEVYVRDVYYNASTWLTSGATKEITMYLQSYNGSSWTTESVILPQAEYITETYANGTLNLNKSISGLRITWDWKGSQGGNMRLYSLNYTSLQSDYTFVTNGNKTFNYNATDGTNIQNTSGVTLVNPYLTWWFKNQTGQFLTNFSINGTNYNNNFSVKLFDYGYGSKSFQFQKTVYPLYNFTRVFNSTSFYNETLVISTAKINFYIKSVDTGALVTPNNFTILINNIDELTTDTYNLVNNNTLQIPNIYAVDTTLQVSLVVNDSIVYNVVLVSPSENINQSLYITNQTEELRTFEVLSSSLSPVTESYVYLYTYVDNLSAFVLQSQKQTNDLGKVTFRIVPLTKVYNICNTFEGNEKCLTQVTFEDLDTDPNQIIHASDLTSNEKIYLNNISFSNSESKGSSSTVLTFTFEDNTSVTNRFFMNVTRYTNGTASYLGEFGLNDSSGSVSQNFTLKGDQYIEYELFYDYGNDKISLQTLTTFAENPDFDDLKNYEILNLVFLLIYFGAIGILLRFTNFEWYNIAILSLLLIAFGVSSYLSEDYVNLTIWGVMAVKTAVIYAVRYEK